MERLSSRELRSRYIEFFKEKGHVHVPSSPIVPDNDPTLLFTTAGMVQFKDVFLGTETRPYKRAVSSQKCMRAGGKHNDLENVGPSIRHQTFFEMLGNFSFGDYFKRVAIEYAWELLTERFGLDPERLWPTIYLDDDESFNLWQEVAGVPARKITRRGKEDNFWAMGDRGPCGPNTEIYWDFYPERGETDNPATDEDRFFEVWNLVFMQFDQPGDGSLVPLEKPGVDTGMGLERMSVVLQGVGSTYETDLFAPIIERTRELTGHSKEEMQRQIASYRVIADHGRAATFLIGEGVLPGNEMRSYVLRRVMRRAMVHGRKLGLGLEGPFLGEIARVVMEIMGDVYPEIVQRKEFILKAIANEEESFARTLVAGLNRFDQVSSSLRLQSGDVFPGEEMFRLYDTFGLSKDLIADLASARGFGTDAEGYEEAMSRQRGQSKAASKFGAGERETLDVYQQVSPQPTEFLGYDYSNLDFGFRISDFGFDGSGNGVEPQRKAVRNGVETIRNPKSEIRNPTGTVLGVIRDKQIVAEAGQGEDVEVVLDRTPFYPEGGGQVGDKGFLTWDGGRMEVRDTRRPVGGVIVHRGVVLEGTLRTGSEAEAHVPGSVRWDTMRNHTATHLLHKALRDVLGTHAHQAGSIVEPGRLRFDFTHGQALSREELIQIERIANEQIRADYPVIPREISYQEALAEGAMALFGEKYGSVVRMVRIPGFESKELCGGTHVERTGQIGAMYITYEGSIGSGIRRIEAVTGAGAVEYAQERREMLAGIAQRLHTTPERATEAVTTLQEQLRDATRRVETLQRQIARGEMGGMEQQVREVSGVKVLTGKAQAESVETLKEAGDHLRDKLGSGVVVLGAIIEGEPKLVAMVTADIIERGVSAGEIIKEIAPTVGGKGGGRPNMALGGGKDAEGLDRALEMVGEVVGKRLS
ncbi:MAG TPA: alanine--tRNA ligase [Chloroflexia bacterium]|nr:alanine--tRNA ligase [Chloroflexia bacterium]